MCREYTVEEVRELFLDQIMSVVDYWAKDTREIPVKERCEGVAFSIMNIIDGTSCLPAFNLFVSPHESDEEFNKNNGDNWFPENAMINDCYLHEMLFNKEKTE